jgi:hypothetical protein
MRQTTVEVSAAVVLGWLFVLAVPTSAAPGAKAMLNSTRQLRRIQAVPPTFQLSASLAGRTILQKGNNRRHTVLHQWMNSREIGALVRRVQRRHH